MNDEYRDAMRRLRDPKRFQRLLWPHVQMYDKQWDVIYGVRDSAEVFVPAGNMLGG